MAPSIDRSLAVALVLVLLSLQGYTVLLLLEYLPSLRSHPAGVAALGVVCLGGFGALALYCFRRCGCALSLSAMFFAVTGWSALVDLVLAAALVNATVVGKFYMETGEEYFKSSWGFWALVWDGTAHYCLQLYPSHATLLDKPRRVPGLFWCGSIINSMPVLLLGAATGRCGLPLDLTLTVTAQYEYQHQHQHQCDSRTKSVPILAAATPPRSSQAPP